MPHDDLPAVGTVYRVPLKDGRVGVCRVLSMRTTEDGEPRIVVAACPWIGTEPPDLADPVLREILVLSHHSWQDVPEVISVSTPQPPDDYLPLGLLEPTADEAALRPNRFTGWASPAIQILAQWQWENDPEAVARADAEREALEATERHYQKTARQAFLDSVKLTNLENAPFLDGWEEYVPEAALVGSRSALHTLVVALRAAPTRDEATVRRHLQTCVEVLNDLHATHSFIDTLEREDLTDVFEVITAAAKQPHLATAIDDWRTW